MHLTGNSYIGCFTYQDEDMAPVLAIKDQHIDVSITVPDRSQVTDEDLLMARVLAQAVAEYVAELERRAATVPKPAAGPKGTAGQAALWERRCRRGGWSWYLRPPLCSLP